MKHKLEIIIPNKYTKTTNRMIFFIIFGIIGSIPTELENRCLRYGIKLDDCNNSIYIPKQEYDEYLKSFNLPILRDSNCTKDKCIAVVYKNTNKCLNCKTPDCIDECSRMLRYNEVSNSYLNNTPRGPLDSIYRSNENIKTENDIPNYSIATNSPQIIRHIIHNEEKNKECEDNKKKDTIERSRRDSTQEKEDASNKKEEKPIIDDKKKMKEEIIKEIEEKIKQGRSDKKEIEDKKIKCDDKEKEGEKEQKNKCADKEKRDEKEQKSKESEKKDTKTYTEVKTVTIEKPFEETDNKTNIKQTIPPVIGSDDISKKVSNKINMNVQKGMQTNNKRPINMTNDIINNDSVMPFFTPLKVSTKENEPEAITVTRIFTKTKTVESPITLYREVTTTISKELPIINYKVTTLTEVSTLLKTVEKSITTTVSEVKTTTIIPEINVKSKSIRPIPLEVSRNEVNYKDESKYTEANIPTDEIQKIEPVDEKKTKVVSITEIPKPKNKTSTVVIEKQPELSTIIITKTVEKQPESKTIPKEVKTEIVSVTPIMPPETVKPNISLIATKTPCETQSTVISVSIEKSFVTVTETKTLNQTTTVPSSLSVSFSSIQPPNPIIKKQTEIPEPTIVEELAPVIKSYVMENFKKLNKKKKTPCEQTKASEPSVVTKVITSTVTEPSVATSAQKTVINTIFSYRKIPICKTRTRNRMGELGCEDPKEIEVTTTVYV